MRGEILKHARNFRVRTGIRGRKKWLMGSEVGVQEGTVAKRISTSDGRLERGPASGEGGGGCVQFLGIAQVAGE